jgi:hypothetical protein
MMMLVELLCGWLFIMIMQIVLMFFLLMEPILITKGHAE